MQKRVDPATWAPVDADASVSGDAGSIDFEQLIAAVRRQARVVAIAAGAGLLIGLAYVITASPKYTATTDLLIDSQKDQNQLTATIAELNFDTSAIDSQVEVLKSEKIALSVVKSLKLTSDSEFMGARGSLVFLALNAIRKALDIPGWFTTREKSDAEVDPQLERAAVGRLVGNLDVRRVGRTYVLAIQCTSLDRNKAATIANAVAEAYLDEQLDAKFDAARRAAGWLQTRLAELKQQSLESDFAIQRFKAQNGIVLTGGDRPGLISDQQLTELSEQMVAAHADTARAEARQAQIEELLKSGRTGIAVPDSLANPVINDFREKYLGASKLEAQLEAKLGPAHQQVVELKKEMEQYNRLVYEELQRTSESYHSDTEVARAKEKSLAASMSGLVGQNALTNDSLVQLRELERESETYRSLYQTFMQRFQEAQQRESFPVTEARVITAATPPGTPSSPKFTFIATLGLMLGGILGAGIGAVREYRDRVFRVASHVRDGLGLEFLGVLQDIRGSDEVRAAHSVAVDPRHVRPIRALQRYVLDHPLSSFTETLRSAKVAADLALGEKHSKVIAVISVLPKEGKSTVAKNFASLLAHLGAETLLIDADLRNPGLTRAIAGKAEVGLLEALQGNQPYTDYLLSEPDSGLFFLPAVVKKRVLHTSELVSSMAMRSLLEAAGQRFRYVIVDLPPLGPVVDVKAAASLFDAFLFVAEWGKTPRSMVQTLLAGDEALYNKCIGVVYNKVNMKRVNLYENYGSKYYHYGSYAKYYQNEKV